MVKKILISISKFFYVTLSRALILFSQLRAPYYIQDTIFQYFSAYYETFLLVILCKYDLSAIKFAIAKFFFCGLFMGCCAEAANSYVDLFDFVIMTLNDWLIHWPLGNHTYGEIYKYFFPDSPVPKDLYMFKDLAMSDAYTSAESLKTVDPTEVDSTKVDEANGRPNRIFTGICAIAILSIGVCIARSGG